MSGGADEPRAAIMEATYDALVRHGYADLTIQAIADEYDKSKSLLYYHFDSKEDILRAFLTYLLEAFSDEIAAHGGPDQPAADLDALLDRLLPPELEDEEGALRLALLDLQLQAAYEETYRDAVDELFTGLKAAIADVLRAGVADGTFRGDIDPELEAELLFAAINGASLGELTVHPDSQERAREAIDAHVDRLLAE